VVTRPAGLQVEEPATVAPASSPSLAPPVIIPIRARAAKVQVVYREDAEEGRIVGRLCPSLLHSASPIPELLPAAPLMTTPGVNESLQLMATDLELESILQTYGVERSREVALRSFEDCSPDGGGADGSIELANIVL